jgi:hypothetical protein
MARPGVVINWCSSILEWRGAVARSEVPAFRYEFALGQVEQKTAARDTSVHRPSPAARLHAKMGVDDKCTTLLRRKGSLPNEVR